MDAETAEVVRNIVLTTLASIGLALLIRELICWYWKVNKIIDTLNATNGKLDMIAASLANIDANLADDINTRNGITPDAPEQTVAS